MGIKGLEFAHFGASFFSFAAYLLHLLATGSEQKLK